MQQEEEGPSSRLHSEEKAISLIRPVGRETCLEFARNQVGDAGEINEKRTTRGRKQGQLQLLPLLLRTVALAIERNIGDGSNDTSEKKQLGNG